MNTRHQTAPGPLSQQRYMSSPEFAELHGISGVATSARAAILLHAAKKNLVWFIQGLSLVEGGLKRVARELVEMFPKRLRDDGQDIALRQRRGFSKHGFDEDGDPVPYIGASTPNLEEFLVDLCINPRIYFALPWEDVDVSDIESDCAIEFIPGLSKGDFKKAELFYFRDIIGALFEYKKRYEARVCENFQLTAVAKKIWQTLDYALASHGMVLLDGLEGRGKTAAVKAYCEMHLGESRFVSLKGITSKTTAFREIAKALGIASSYTRTATEMQARIEDVLKRSRLLLVLDEAHFLFNQSRRMYSRPELIDWIDTAICNCGVGCALVTTPQFIVCMTRAADQVEWNYRQFRRRVKRWVKLPAANTEDDIKAVARNVFKKVPVAALDNIVGYALLSKRDLSAVGDVATEVRAMLGTDDLSNATLKHVHSAIYDFLLPSDKTFLEGMEAARKTGRKPFRKPPLVLPEDALQEPRDESKRAGLGIVPMASGLRRRAGQAADLVAA